MHHATVAAALYLAGRGAATAWTAHLVTLGSDQRRPCDRFNHGPAWQQHPHAATGVALRVAPTAAGAASPAGVGPCMGWSHQCPTPADGAEPTAACAARTATAAAQAPAAPGHANAQQLLAETIWGRTLLMRNVAQAGRPARSALCSLARWGPRPGGAGNRSAQPLRCRGSTQACHATVHSTASSQAPAAASEGRPRSCERGLSKP